MDFYFQGYNASNLNIKNIKDKAQAKSATRRTALINIFGHNILIWCRKSTRAFFFQGYNASNLNIKISKMNIFLNNYCAPLTNNK